MTKRTPVPDSEITKVIQALTRLLLSRGVNHQEVKDMVQELLLRAHAKGTFDIAANPEAFLVRSAINLAHDSGRRKKVRSKWSDDATAAARNEQSYPWRDETFSAVSAEQFRIWCEQLSSGAQPGPDDLATRKEVEAFWAKQFEIPVDRLRRVRIQLKRRSDASRPDKEEK
jgi:DNA-directed RNA polymerase specialized sigma24 family protein